MTALKVAVVNVAMWARDHVLPASYAHAIWRRLMPVFRLPGRLAYGPETVTVVLRHFNDRALNRDLAAVCARLAEVRAHLPDGRRLELTIEGTIDGARSAILDAHVEAIA